MVRVKVKQKDILKKPTENLRTYTSIYLQYYKILKYANIYFWQCKIKFPSKWQPIAFHERGSPWNPD